MVKMGNSCPRDKEELEVRMPITVAPMKEISDTWEICYLAAGQIPNGQFAKRLFTEDSQPNILN